MPGSKDTWHPIRMVAFVALGVLIYTGLFVWSEGVRAAHADRNPFHKITQAPAHHDWIILGASHAVPLGFDGVPARLRAVTGQTNLTLAVPGGGPAVSRLIAERYFADHTARGVLVVVNEFALLDARWNMGRVGDGDILPKIPADPLTLGVLVRAMPRGLPLGTVLAYGTGFARINDQTRFEADRWDAAARFDSAQRPSAAADAARIAYLYPDLAAGSMSEPAIARGLADLAALIALAKAQGARVVLVFPPLPDRFRARLPEIPGLRQRLTALAAELGVDLVDHENLIPEAAHYFDTDHLNRAGVDLWLDQGLGAILRGLA